MHKRAVELFRLTKQEWQIAERAYFANRIEFADSAQAIARKKRAMVEKAAGKALPMCVTLA